MAKKISYEEKMNNSKLDSFFKKKAKKSSDDDLEGE